MDQRKAMHHKFLSYPIRNLLLVSCFVLIGSCMAYCQSNHIPLKGKSFIGALEFMPNGSLAQNYYRVKSPFPGELDPMLDPYKWYGEGDEQVSGMVKDAMLVLEWWIKGSEPLERYKFDWTSSGYFDVKYVDDNGEKVQKRITWYDLQKYPNLKRRYELINPYNISFQFTFHSGDKSEKDYWGFRNRYKIMEDLGSAGYAVDYTRTIKPWKTVIIHGPLKKDWGAPQILVGGWKEFLPLADKHKDKESRLLELFKMGRTIVMGSFKITEINWKVSEFVYIAKKFAAYESGKEKPDADEQVAAGKVEERAGDESWDETDIVDSETEAFRDPNGKMGIRTKKGRVLKDAIYSQILQSKIDKYYIASREKEVHILNNMGVVIATKSCGGWPSLYACENGELRASFEESSESFGEVHTTDYFLDKGQAFVFQGGAHSRSLKYFSAGQKWNLSLIVGSSYNTPEEREQAEREDREYERLNKIRVEEINRARRAAMDALRAQGYVDGSTVVCK